MLSETDKNYVIDVLTEWVAPTNEPRATLAAPFVGTTLPEALRDGNPRELVIDAVRLCLIDAWGHDPPWLVLLLSIFSLQENDAKIAEILGRLRKPPAPTVDPLNVTILGTGAPFVNRTTLRLQLNRLATPDARAQPILVVTGPCKSGKSYSANYIDHFSYIRSPIITYRLALDAEFALEMGAEQVARDLVSMMGRPLNAMPTPNTNQKLYVRQLALWVLNEAAQTPPQNWFILDNFRGEKLRVDTRDLLIALSDLITTGVFSQRCRLILIGFDRALLTVDPGRVEEESIGPFSPAEAKISIIEILSRAPVPVAADLVFPFVLSNLPNNDGLMEELNMRLRALLLAVSEVRRILEGLSGTDHADYLEILLKMLEDLPSGQDCLPMLKSRLAALRESAMEL